MLNEYKHCFNANILTINTFKVCGDPFHHTRKWRFENNLAYFFAL